MRRCIGSCWRRAAVVLVLVLVLVLVRVLVRVLVLVSVSVSVPGLFIVLVASFDDARAHRRWAPEPEPAC